MLYLVDIQNWLYILVYTLVDFQSNRPNMNKLLGHLLRGIDCLDHTVTVDKDLSVLLLHWLKKYKVKED